MAKKKRKKTSSVVYFRIPYAVNMELDRRAEKLDVTKQQVIREILEKALGMEIAA